jgi:hypothetical protein
LALRAHSRVQCRTPHMPLVASLSGSEVRAGNIEIG